MQTFPDVTVTELAQMKEKQADFTLLDVRELHEYEICNIEGVLIPMQTLPDRLNELNKDQHIVVHCRSGGRSSKVKDYLLANGFSKVSNLTGGIMAWIDQINPALTKY